MKTCAKVLMVAAAVAMFSVGAKAQDDCATAVSATCNGAGATVDPTNDATPTGPLGSCTSGGGVLDNWVTFVASDTTARVRTDLSSAGTDSDYIVYSVDQADICNSASWVEIGCSEDEGAGFLGDIGVATTAGDTYLVQVGTWSDAANGTYTVDVECPEPCSVCGDGCISTVPGLEDCDGALTGSCLTTCDPDCTCTPVPTPMLPKWGLIGLALLLVAGGAAVFGRNRVGFQQA